MKWEYIEENWEEFKHQAKQQWDRLGDAQLDAIAGARDQLAESIQLAYGISAHAAEWQLSGWQNRLQEIECAT
jgi:uncharacterized protein YjbJ (UPF0337 family)